MRGALLIVLSLVAAPAAAQNFFTLKGHGGPIMDIAVSPTGQIATASFDNSIGTWIRGTPTWFDGHAAAVKCVVFVDATRAVSGGDDFAVLSWELAAGTATEIGRHKGKIMGLAISPDHRHVASASWDGTIGLWPLGDGSARSLRGHGQGVNAVAFSADGHRLYSASTDGTVRVWDVASGQETRQLVKHGFGVNRLILNEKDGWLAYGAVDGVTRIVDLATGDQIADFTLDRRPILALAYHAPTRQLAVGDGEGYVMVIDTAARRIARDFKAARQGPIWALAFSPNGQNLHAGGIEDVMYSWPVDALTEHGPMNGAARSFLADPATLPNGERQFKRKCSICHALTPGSARKAGPTLHGVFGRRAGTVADYAYSDTLQGSDIVWSETTIDSLFDLGPDHFIPGTKMPMQRIAGAEDRRDLIDYLQRATARGGN